MSATTDKQRFLPWCENSLLLKKAKALGTLWKRKKYNICKVLMCILGVLLGLSVVRYLGWIHTSFAGLLAEVAPSFYTTARRAISIAAVVKIGDVIGICSVIIVWIYTALDKRELGFRYSELLEEICPGYYRMLLLHMGAFLVCMWTAKIEKLEAAALAMSIVLVGNILQWNVLRDLVLLSERRIEAAGNQWKKTVQGKQKEDLRVVIYQMAGELEIETGSRYKTMVRELTRGIGKYITEEASNREHYILRDVADMWECILDGKDKDAKRGRQELITLDILRECRGKPWEGKLCTGYLLWLHNALVRGANSKKERNAAQQEIVEIRDSLLQSLFRETEMEKISLYLNVGSAMLFWMYFYYGHTAIDTSHLNADYMKEKVASGDMIKDITDLGSVIFSGAQTGLDLRHGLELIGLRNEEDTDAKKAAVQPESTEMEGEK